MNVVAENGKVNRLPSGAEISAKDILKKGSSTMHRSTKAQDIEVDMFCLSVLLVFFLDRLHIRVSTIVKPGCIRSSAQKSVAMQAM